MAFHQKELAELIAMDPALTVKILSLANSSFIPLKEALITFIVLLMFLA